MNKYLVVSLVSLCLFLLAGQILSATVDDIAVTTSDSNIVVSILTDAQSYQEIAVPPPARIVLDFPNSEYKVDKPNIEINKGNLLAVRSGQFKSDVARVVIDLKEQTPHSIKRTDRGFDIVLEVKGIPGVPGEEPTSAERVETEKEEKITAKPEEMEIFSYSSRGRRDPFKPLVGLPSEEDTLLDVRGAQVVGIVWSPAERYALIQAADGEVHIVEEGDRVRNGKVDKIEKKSVEFYLWELGRSERLTLRIKEKE